MTISQSGVAAAGTRRRPREDEIDAHGVTHPGKVRRDNQDHYLLCSLRRQVVVRGSSIPHAEALIGDSERMASLAPAFNRDGHSPTVQSPSFPRWTWIWPVLDIVHATVI